MDISPSIMIMRKTLKLFQNVWYTLKEKNNLWWMVPYEFPKLSFYFMSSKEIFKVMKEWSDSMANLYTEHSLEVPKKFSLETNPTIYLFVQNVASMTIWC